ncbi:hypothetical protein DEJ50_04035 [Streptomyces venezuelae]|uniref:Integral membrane protein n=1 Tax=Streptomyces venezuelae TaxID=54571 RepID=A0A5P2DBN7_STRVZ|nr:hypothetical protein DEJ50_04035 [Streptomyces venezuelae]
MKHMSALALSVLLCLVSALAYAAGAIVQEQVAVAHPNRPYAPLRQAGWWVAVALNGAGGLLHVAALAYGPLSLVQPLGALTIVFALPMAAVFVRRRAGVAAWRGALMATVGLAGLLALTGGDGRTQTLAVAEQSVLLAFTTAGVAGLFLAARRVLEPVTRSVLLALAAGVAFGMASVFTKSVAESATGESAVAATLGQWPALAAIAVLAVGGLLLSQAAYRGAGLAAPLATLTVVNPVVAAAVGISLFDEGFRYGALGATAALVSGALAAAGLILLTAVPPHARVSDAHPVAAEVRQRVDVGAVPGPRTYLEVQVGTRTVAGRAGAGDPLTADDLLAGLDGQRGQVRVLGKLPVAVADHDLVAVGTGPAGRHDHARADGLD